MRARSNAFSGGSPPPQPPPPRSQAVIGMHRSPTAQSGGSSDVAKCPNKGTITVTVRRKGTTDKVGGVTIRASGGPSAGDKTTADGTGIASFLLVEPATYDVAVVLSEALAKKYKAVPTSTGNEIKKGTDLALTFDLEPIVKLRVVLVDKAGAGVKDASWEVASLSKTGKTGDDGKIELDVAADLANAELKVTLPPIPPKSPPPTATPSTADPPPYPPAIVTTEFKDEAAKAPPTEVKWTLTIQDLEDFDGDDGLKARLHNLGFCIDDDDRTTASVKAYQLMGGDKDGSGALADVKDKLTKAHDDES